MKFVSKSEKRKRALGALLVPRSDKQQEYFDALFSSEIRAVVAIGLPGTGKSMFAAYYAAAAYNDKFSPVRRIVLIRPNVGTGEEIGFLPGDEFDKTYVFHVQMSRYLQTYLEMTEEELFGLDGTNPPIVEIQSFWTLQGQDLTDALVICDESQNMTVDEMFILATRGAHKFICIGDTNESQVLRADTSSLDNGLALFYECMSDLDYVKNINFDSPDDIMRPGIVKDAIMRLMPKITELKAKKRAEAALKKNTFKKESD